MKDMVRETLERIGDLLDDYDGDLQSYRLFAAMYQLYQYIYLEAAGVLLTPDRQRAIEEAQKFLKVALAGEKERGGGASEKKDPKGSKAEPATDLKKGYI
jgi:hypothetical protein